MTDDLKHLTDEERATLVACEGCGVHLPMKAAHCDDEDPIYMCARCVIPFALDKERRALQDAARLLDAERAAHAETRRELARLRAEVERQARALEAGPAALLVVESSVPVNRPYLASIVEAAQARALKGEE